jgi:transcriptional regulator with XRE-family HTH domain
MGKKFGEYLKQLRDDRKMTLRDVEEKAKISNAYLSQVENGQRSIPTMRILSRLAQAYGVPASHLAEKAEEEIQKHKIESKGPKPAPETEFISRGYEKLSDENKQALKKFLQHLQNEER